MPSLSVDGQYRQCHTCRAPIRVVNGQSVPPPGGITVWRGEYTGTAVFLTPHEEGCSGPIVDSLSARMTYGNIDGAHAEAGFIADLAFDFTSVTLIPPLQEGPTA